MQNDKQRYLNEIVSQENLNIELFKEYAKIVKGASFDYMENDDCTLDDLKMLVLDFIKTNRDKFQENSIKAESEIGRSKASYDNQSEYKIDNFFSQDIDQSYKNHSDNIIMNLRNKSKAEGALYSKEQPLKLRIIDTKTVNGNGISQAYVMYKINCQQLDINVFRRYNDFLWLHSTLEEYYPGIFIPPIPLKSVIDKIIDSAFIPKRMKKLQRFLDHIVRQKILVNSEIFYFFITETNEKNFQGKKAHYSNWLPVVNYQSAVGQYVLQPENEGIILNLKKKLKMAEGNLKEIDSELKDLIKDMASMSNRFRNLSSLYDKLYKNCLSSNEIFPEESLRTFYNYTNLFKGWTNSYSNQMRLFDTNIRTFFSFIKDEYSSFGSLISKHDKAKDEYRFEDMKLSSKKEKFFNLQNYNKWELSEEDFLNRDILQGDKMLAFRKMLRTETNAVTELRLKYKFMSKSVVKEFSKLRKYHSELFVSHGNDLAACSKEMLGDVFAMMKLVTGNFH